MTQSSLLQDFVTLGGEYLGPPHFVVFVDGFGTPRTWDKRKGYGSSGATLVFTGEDLAKGTLHVQAHEKPSAWLDTWEAFARKVLVKEPTGPSPQALPISHPILLEPPVSVTSVVVEDVTPWKVDDFGLWGCDIKLSVFRSPTPGLGNPKSTGIPDAKKKIPTAQDAADRENAELLAQFQKRGKEEGFL